jgi:arylsulfatase
MQQVVGKLLMSFKDFPPRQKPSSFTVDDALEMVMKHSGGPAK